MEDCNGAGDSQSSADFRPVARIIASMLDTGQIDGGARAELERALRKDDTVLQNYLELVDLDARLRWAFRGGSAPQPAANGNAVALNGATAIRDTDRSERRVASHRRSNATVGDLLSDRTANDSRTISRRLTPGSVWRKAAAIAIAASVLAVLASYAVVHDWLGTNGMGVVSQSAGASWGEPHAALAVGAPIGFGELRLETGVAEITLRDNTRLIVEGPSTFEIVAADKLFVRDGTVSVFVSPTAVGFTANTPDARVIDLGTAFQVRVAESGTEVHVIEGKVLASAAGVGGGSARASEIRLSERDAVRFDRGSHSITAIDFVGEQLRLRGDASLSTMPMAVTGDIRCLERPPTSVAVGEFEDDDEMYLFLEQSNVVVEKTIFADRNSKGEIARKQGNLNMMIPAGTRVASYLLHYDPTTRTNDDPLHRVSGTITFRSPIDCIFLHPIGLYESDKHFRNKDTCYFRGDPKLSAKRAVEDADFVSFSPDRRTLIVNFKANSSADQIRIIMLNQHDR